MGGFAGRKTPGAHRDPNRPFLPWLQMGPGRCARTPGSKKTALCGLAAGQPSPSQAHLVTVSMSPNGDGLRPAWDQARDVLADDGLSENRPAQDVPDGAIGALPHLLQLEFCRSHEGDASGIGARMTCPPPPTPAASSGSTTLLRQMLSRGPLVELLPRLVAHTFHTGLIGGDGGALHSHAVLLSGQG